jgi:hypothetical protein
MSVCWSVGTELVVFRFLFCVGNPYVGVSEAFGDDANFPADTLKFCPFCGCLVRVVFLVMLFLCLISKGCYIYLLAGYVW